MISHFSDWKGIKTENSAWFQLNRKSATTIKIWYNLTRLRLLFPLIHREINPRHPLYQPKHDRIHEPPDRLSVNTDSNSDPLAYIWNVEQFRIV